MSLTVEGEFAGPRLLVNAMETPTILVMIHVSLRSKYMESVE